MPTTEAPIRVMKGSLEGGDLVVTIRDGFGDTSQEVIINIDKARREADCDSRIRFYDELYGVIEVAAPFVFLDNYGIEQSLTRILRSGQSIPLPPGNHRK